MMDNEFLNGLILSYNKILKEIKPLKEELNSIKEDVKLLVEGIKNKQKLVENQNPGPKKKNLVNKKVLVKKKVIDTKDPVKINFQSISYRKKPRKTSVVVTTDQITIADKSNTDFFTNLGNDLLI